MVSKIDNLKIVAKATYSGGGSRGARQNSFVTISEFKINLKEIEFKLDDNYYGNDDNGNDDNGNDDNGNDETRSHFHQKLIDICIFNSEKLF